MSLLALARRHERFIRFLLVGGLNTLFGYGVYALTLFLGGHYTLASAVALVLGVLFNFKTTGRLVFGARGNGRFLAFVTVYMAVYAFNIAAIWVLEQAGVDPYIGGLVVILPQAVLAYALMSRFVFTKAVSA